jgi:hypothetical protein
MRRSPWVLVDSAWAKQLGVTRTAGEYRISRRELMRKMAGEPLGGPGIWASIDGQGLKVGGSSSRRVA